VTLRRNTLTVTWRGRRATGRAIRGLGPAAKRGAVKGLHAVALVLQSEVRRSILKGPATGRIYRRRGIVHQASAPGEAPQSDTGTLARSVISEVDEQQMEAVVTAGTRYAKWLEFGTRLMAARPFMAVALRKMVQRIKAIMKAAIEAEIVGVK